MTTRRSRRKALTERLRAIAGLSRCACDLDTYAPPDLIGHLDPKCPLHKPPRSRVHTASFEHTHRVWIAPDPPRRWFEAQNIEKVPAEFQIPLHGRKKWWNL